MQKYIENKETRKLAQILNLPEIRSGRIDNAYHPSQLSYLKTGKSTSIREDVFLSTKRQLNEFSVKLSNFLNKKTTISDAYLLELMDLIDEPFLNWKVFYSKINCLEKPNAAYLQHSYYNGDSRRGSNTPSSLLIEKYPQFFEQLKFELKLLSSKLKI